MQRSFLLTVAIIAVAFAVFSCKPSTHDRGDHVQLNDNFEKCRSIIQKNDYRIPGDDISWREAIGKLNKGNTKYIVHPRKPYIHFEVLSNTLDNHIGLIHVPSGRSIQDYCDNRLFNYHRLIQITRLNDEWYEIIYD
jgi:hypothetical protein